MGWDCVALVAYTILGAGGVGFILGVWAEGTRK